MLMLADDNRSDTDLPQLVQDMDDGGMGSIQFGRRADRKFGRDIVQVRYIDLDNTPIFITLIEDSSGDLFELEFWKVDNSRLLKYPPPSDTELLRDYDAS